MAKPTDISQPFLLSDGNIPDWELSDGPCKGDPIDPDIAWILGFILVDILAFIVLCGVIGLKLLGWI